MYPHHSTVVFFVASSSSHASACSSTKIRYQNLRLTLILAVYDNRVSDSYLIRTSNEASMLFHQRRFFPFGNGAPSIHSLQTHPTINKVLATTDRTVQKLTFDATKGYSLDDIPFLDGKAECAANVIASGFIHAPGRERIVVVYAEESGQVDESVGEPSEEPNDKMFLRVVDPQNPPPDSSRADKESNHPRRTRAATGSRSNQGQESVRFELVAAPTAMWSVRARSLGSGGAQSVFNGVIVFRMESMVAFGFVDEVSGVSGAQCVRLTNEQFASFFPEFAQFRHPVLSVDTHVIRSDERGWIAFGCADGFIRIFAGALDDGILSGPYDTRDIYMKGPVMSLSLFTTARDSRYEVNLLTGCAIGEAIIFEDIFDRKQSESIRQETLFRSDEYDSILSVVAADVDLDGEVELLVGTDNQVLLAYKRIDQQNSNSPVKEESTQPPSRTGSLHGKTVRRWELLPLDSWEVRVFGGLYSLCWLDLNRDGVNELVVVSATGVYLFEAEPELVLERLNTMLSKVVNIQELTHH